MQLEARLAAGEAPATDAALGLRARQLSSVCCRERIAHGLELVLAENVRLEAVSSALPVHHEALGAARSVLEQVVVALRMEGPVNPHGVARARRLLTEAASPLYAPRQVQALQDAAREALLALRLPPIER